MGPSTPTAETGCWYRSEWCETENRLLAPDPPVSRRRCRTRGRPRGGTVPVRHHAAEPGLALCLPARWGQSSAMRAESRYIAPTTKGATPRLAYTAHWLAAETETRWSTGTPCGRRRATPGRKPSGPAPSPPCRWLPDRPPGRALPYPGARRGWRKQAAGRRRQSYAWHAPDRRHQPRKWPKLWPVREPIHWASPLARKVPGLSPHWRAER